MLPPIYQFQQDPASSSSKRCQDLQFQFNPTGLDMYFSSSASCLFLFKEIPIYGDSRFKKPFIDNKQSLQTGSGNCSMGGCQEPIEIATTPTSIAPLLMDRIFVCFLFDQTKDHCKKWPDRYGGCPHLSYHIHAPAQRKLHPLHKTTLYLYIQDPWDPRWEAGVVGKLYRHYKPDLPISTTNIQRKYVLITQSLGMGMGMRRQLNTPLRSLPL